MIIKNYQQRRELEKAQQPPPTVYLATVHAVYVDGISIILDGEKTPKKKHCKYNKSIDFYTGQRVKVCKINGGFIVEYPF